MRIAQLKELHQRVVHGQMTHSEKCQAYDTAHSEARLAKYFPASCDLCKEEVWIKKYPYDTLEAVCEECFGLPDRYVTKEDLIDLNTR